MYVRRKIRNRLIIFAVILLVAVYWRGVSSYVKKNHLDCNWHAVYAVCKQTGSATKVPSLWDVLKAGVKF